MKPTPENSSIKGVFEYLKTLKTLENNKIQTVDQKTWEPVNLKINLN